MGYGPGCLLNGKRSVVVAVKRGQGVGVVGYNPQQPLCFVETYSLTRQGLSAGDSTVLRRSASFLSCSRKRCSLPGLGGALGRFSTRRL